MHERGLKNDTVQLLPSKLFLRIKWSFAAVKHIPPDKMGPLNKKRLWQRMAAPREADTSPGGAAAAAACRI